MLQHCLLRDGHNLDKQWPCPNLKGQWLLRSFPQPLMRLLNIPSALKSHVLCRFLSYSRAAFIVFFGDFPFLWCSKDFAIHIRLWVAFVTMHVDFASFSGGFTKEFNRHSHKTFPSCPWKSQASNLKVTFTCLIDYLCTSVYLDNLCRVFLSCFSCTFGGAGNPWLQNECISAENVSCKCQIGCWNGVRWHPGFRIFWHKGFE